MSVNQVILSALKPFGHPVYPLSYPKTKDPVQTWIIFSQYSENAALHAEDKEQRTTHYIQVDVFTTNPSIYYDLAKKVKNALIDVGFVRRSVIDLYEEDTDTYHNAIRFSYVQNSDVE